MFLMRWILFAILFITTPCSAYDSGNIVQTVTFSSFEPLLWFGNIYPRGYVYNNNLYIVYHGTNGVTDPYIKKYSYSTNTWGAEVKVGDNSLEGSEDSHGNPAVIVDDSGFIHVFYGGHSSDTLQHAKSDSAEDISAWTEQTVINSIGTYPQAFKLSNGDIYLFYREGGHEDDWGYEVSSDNGVTWGSFNSVLQATDGDNHFYAFFNKRTGDTFAVAYHWVDNNASTTVRENFYYMYFDLTNWRDVAGDILTIPVTKTIADANTLILDSSGNNVSLNRPQFESDELRLAIKDSGSNTNLAYESSSSISLKDVGITRTGPVDSNFSDGIFIYTAPGDNDGINEYVSTDGGDNWTNNGFIVENSGGEDQFVGLAIIDNYINGDKLMFRNQKDGSTKKHYIYIYDLEIPLSIGGGLTIGGLTFN